MKWLSAVALCLAVAYVSAQSYDDWIETVLEPHSETVSFNCTNYISDDEGHPRPETGNIMPWENATVDFWLAQLERVDIGGSIRGGNVVVNDNGWTLTVKNVTPEYFGVYHCVMKTDENETYMVKWGINIRGPYFRNLWDKYEMNVIIGFSAMGGFLVLAALVLGVYHYRWTDPEMGSDLDRTSDKVAYINKGYTTDYNTDYNTDYSEPNGGVIGNGVKTLPQDEDYSNMEMRNDPTVVSVAEVHSDSPAPVYVSSAPSAASPLPEPEPEIDTKF